MKTFNGSRSISVVLRVRFKPRNRDSNSSTIQRLKDVGGFSCWPSKWKKKISFCEIREKLIKKSRFSMKKTWRLGLLVSFSRNLEILLAIKPNGSNANAKILRNHSVNIWPKGACGIHEASRHFCRACVILCWRVVMTRSACGCKS